MFASSTLEYYNERYTLTTEMQKLLDNSNMFYDKKLLDSLKESDNYIVMMLDDEQLGSFVTCDIMVDSSLLEYFVYFRDNKSIKSEEFVIFVGHEHDKIIGLIVLDVEKTINSEIEGRLQLFYKLYIPMFEKIDNMPISSDEKNNIKVPNNVCINGRKILDIIMSNSYSHKSAECKEFMNKLELIKKNVSEEAARRLCSPGIMRSFTD